MVIPLRTAMPGEVNLAGMSSELLMIPSAGDGDASCQCLAGQILVTSCSEPQSAIVRNRRAPRQSIACGYRAGSR
jgi:hypothetical protein